MVSPGAGLKITEDGMATQNCLSNLFGDTKRLIILLLIISAGIAIRVYCFEGFWGTDDGEYARLANAMANGGFSAFVQENYIRHFYAPAHLPYRMGLIFPLSVFFRFFGTNETALVIYPLLISVLGIVIAFISGRLLFNVNAGLIAAAIWSALPVDIKNATSFLPDIIASFYASLGVIAVLFIINTGIKGNAPRFLGGLIGGLLFGVSWLSKESIFYLIPFCVFLIISTARKDFKGALPLWAGVAIGSAGVLFTEMLAYYSMRGDFMLRMHENERSFAQTKSYLFYEGSRFGWPVGASHAKALMKRLFLEGPRKIFLNDNYLFLPFFGAIASAHAFYRKDRTFLAPAVWMFTLAFMYNFASCSFSTYTPLVLSERYLHPIIFPAAVLTGGFTAKLIAAKKEGEFSGASERFFWGLVIAFMLISISLYSIFREIKDMSMVRPIYEIRKLSKLVKPTDRIYTDPLSMKALEFYWHYPKAMNLVNFDGMKTGEIAPDSFVLADRFRLDWLKINVSMWLTKDYGYHEPEFFSDPPKSWKKVWQNNHATLYRIE